jgi:hypothetical protein
MTYSTYATVMFYLIHCFAGIMYLGMTNRHDHRFWVLLVPLWPLVAFWDIYHHYHKLHKLRKKDIPHE